MSEEIMELGIRKGLMRAAQICLDLAKTLGSETTIREFYAAMECFEKIQQEFKGLEQK